MAITGHSDSVHPAHAPRLGAGATAGHDRQKMSLRELKEEFKQTEGDPAIKGKMEQVRQVRRRRRMIVAVPKATVSTKE